jgi:hypothetical protein
MRSGLAITFQLFGSQFFRLSFYGAIGVEGFAGAFFEEDFVVAEELVYFVGFFWGNEEDLSVAFAPGVPEVLWGEEDGWGVGEGAAEEHGGGAAVYERDVAAEVEGDGGAVGLIAVEEDLVVERDGVIGFQLLDGFGERFRREHGGEAGEGDVGGDEKDG